MCGSQDVITSLSNELTPSLKVVLCVIPFIIPTAAVLIDRALDRSAEKREIIELDKISNDFGKIKQENTDSGEVLLRIYNYLSPKFPQWKQKIIAASQRFDVVGADEGAIFEVKCREISEYFVGDSDDSGLSLFRNYMLLQNDKFESLRSVTLRRRLQKMYATPNTSSSVILWSLTLLGVFLPMIYVSNKNVQLERKL